MAAKLLVDLVVTLVLWAYFTLGFVVFFLSFYLFAYLFAPDREMAFQRLHHLFYRSFFSLVRILTPRLSWEVDDKALSTSSSVIVCNHVSYLDPLLMISLFARHKTIVKTRFFHLPIFGWFLRNAGYLPATNDKKFGHLFIENVEKMKEYLARGGNLFIFPEGARSRAGDLGLLNRGAFKIAVLCRAPIKVLRISGSDRLFPPGRFLFNSGTRNTITMEFVAAIEPDYQKNSPSAAELEDMVRNSFATRPKPQQPHKTFL